ERDDVRRPFARLGELELTDHCLDVPGIVGAALDPRVPEPQRPRTRQPAELDRVTRPEDEVVEPVGAAAEGVFVMVSDLDDCVSRANLADRLVLPEQPRVAEDVVDLLGAPVRVRRRREPARLDANPVDTDPPRP